MKEVEFITWDELLDAHRTELSLYGGRDGFINEGVVRSAFNRPQFTVQYNADADLADLAADYMYGLTTTQGFLDGNKRTSLMAASIFVRKNGWRFIVTNRLMYLVAIAVAPTNSAATTSRILCTIIWRNWAANDRLRRFHPRSV